MSQPPSQSVESSESPEFQVSMDPSANDASKAQPAKKKKKKKKKKVENVQSPTDDDV